MHKTTSTQSNAQVLGQRQLLLHCDGVLRKAIAVPLGIGVLSLDTQREAGIENVLWAVGAALSPALLLGLLPASVSSPSLVHGLSVTPSSEICHCVVGIPRVGLRVPPRLVRVLGFHGHHHHSSRPRYCRTLLENTGTPSWPLVSHSESADPGCI